MLGGVGLIVLIAGFVWLTGGRYEATDDAYVRVAGVDRATAAEGHVRVGSIADNEASGGVQDRVAARNGNLAAAAGC